MSARFHHRQRLGAIPALSIFRMPRDAVLLGDCIKVMSNFPDASVDLILTVPPYICRYRDRTGRTVANDDNATGSVRPLPKPIGFCVPIRFASASIGGRPCASSRKPDAPPGSDLPGISCLRRTTPPPIDTPRPATADLLMKGYAPMPANPVPDVLPWQYTGNRSIPRKNWCLRSRPWSPHIALPMGWCWTRSADPASLLAVRECGRLWLGIEMDKVHHATSGKRI